MRRMPGRGMSEGAQQLAGFFLFVILLVFFALAIRMEWDRRHGEAVPEWSEVLSRTRRGARNHLLLERPAAKKPREGDVI